VQVAVDMNTGEMLLVSPTIVLDAVKRVLP